MATNARPWFPSVVDALLTGARATLGRDLVGLYLHGSLAAGGFDVRRSDVDFLVVTAGHVSAEALAALEPLHRRIAASDVPLARRLDGSYIPRGAVRRHVSADSLHPHIETGSDELRVEAHGSDWIIQRHVVREHGIVLAGPPARGLIDPVSADALRRAVVALLHEWWAPMRADPVRLRHGGYRTYAVLTMCRMLYTLESGCVVSKRVAGRWARHALDPGWKRVVEDALAWKGDGEPGHAVEDAVGLIDFTVTRAPR